MLVSRVRAWREAGIQRDTDTGKPGRGDVDRINSQAADCLERPQHAPGATLAGHAQQYLRPWSDPQDAGQTLARTTRAEHDETPTIRAATRSLAEDLDEHRPGPEPQPTVRPFDGRTGEWERDLQARRGMPKRTGQRRDSRRPVRRRR